MLHFPRKRGTGRGNKIRYDVISWIISRIDNFSVKLLWIKIVKFVDYALKIVDSYACKEKRGTGRGNKFRYDIISWIIPWIDNFHLKLKWIKIVFWLCIENSR